MGKLEQLNIGAEKRTDSRNVERRAEASSEAVTSSDDPKGPNLETLEKEHEEWERDQELRENQYLIDHGTVDLPENFGNSETPEWYRTDVDLQDRVASATVRIENLFFSFKSLKNYRYLPDSLKERLVKDRYSLNGRLLVHPKAKKEQVETVVKDLEIFLNFAEEGPVPIGPKVQMKSKSGKPKKGWKSFPIHDGAPDWLKEDTLAGEKGKDMYIKARFIIALSKKLEKAFKENKKKFNPDMVKSLDDLREKAGILEQIMKTGAYSLSPDMGKLSVSSGRFYQMINEASDHAVKIISRLK